MKFKIIILRVLQTIAAITAIGHFLALYGIMRSHNIAAWVNETDFLLCLVYVLSSVYVFLGCKKTIKKIKDKS